ALILTPTANDGTLAESVLKESNISALSCLDMEALCQHIDDGCGVVIISEEALTSSTIQKLHCCLGKQEPWSDLPIILLTNSDVVKATEILSKTGNIFLLERPFSRITLVRSVEVALKARQKQYEVRDLMLK